MPGIDSIGDDGPVTGDGGSGPASAPSRDGGPGTITSGDSGDATIAGDAPRLRVEEVIGQGSSIGRYVVLRRLGAGGMGVVHAAYDPELDRKVAIKVLRATGSGTHDVPARTRLMREAQALAKLSHPNVVAVYDVGTVAERVWIAMELVKGQTLADWLEAQPRGWREVLRMMIAAGEGLQAAHEAGLLHRDFKPDNVMLDAGGRVRVMDFGLARAGHETPTERKISGLMMPVGPAELTLRVTGAGSLMGTPGYMAPEQIAERELDPRADQFAFGVSLWQALYGRRPFPGHSVPEVVARVLAGDIERPPAEVRVPGWLRRVCERAMATEPDQRFPSMRALLDALARGQARARRWLVAGAVGAVAAVGLLSLGLQRWDRARQVAACEAEGASIHAVWDDAARERVRAALLATGNSHAQATFDHVAALFDAEAGAWAEHQTRACVQASVEQRWDPDTFDRARWCLEDRRLALESVVRILSEADPGTVDRAIPAVAGLEPSAACLDEDALEHAPPPPAVEQRPRIAEAKATLAHIGALQRLGKRSEGLAAIEALRGEVAEIGWGPLTARVSVMESFLLQGVGDLARAEDVGITAYVQAAESAAWGEAADMASQLAYLTGCAQARPAEGRVWIEHAAIAAGLAGDSLGLHEALRLGTLANIALYTGSYDEARALNEQVLALRTARLGPEHYSVGRVLVNLGTVASAQGGRAAEARQAYERGLAILERTLGPEHPDLAVVILNLGSVEMDEGDLEGARARFERAIAIQSASLSADHPELAMSYLNLAVVHAQTGEHEEALRLVQRAIGMWERTLDPQHGNLGLGYFNLGSIEESRGRPREAKAAYEHAVAIYRHNEGVQPYEHETAMLLAQLLLKEGDRARALALARSVRDELRALGPSRAGSLAEIEMWIAKTGARGS